MIIFLALILSTLIASPEPITPITTEIIQHPFTPAVLGQNTQNLSKAPDPTAIPTPLQAPKNTPISSSIPSQTPYFQKPTPRHTNLIAKKKQPTGPELDALFTKYSYQYKIDRVKLRKIAICESNLNINAHNLYYLGLYQFSESSWKSYRKLMGTDTDQSLRVDPEQSIKTAAWMISTGRENAWPNCK